MTHIPDSPDELLAMQQAGITETAGQVLDSMPELTIADSLAITIELVREVLHFHATITTELFQDPAADRHQMQAWSRDTERLKLALEILQSVDPAEVEE